MRRDGPHPSPPSGTGYTRVGQHQGSLALLPLHQRRRTPPRFHYLDARPLTTDPRALAAIALQIGRSAVLLHNATSSTASAIDLGSLHRRLPSTASRRLCDRAYPHHRSRLACPHSRNGRHAGDGHHSTAKHHGHCRRRRGPARTAPVLLRKRGMHLPETQLLGPFERRAGCPHGRENGAGQSIPPHSLVTPCFFDRVARLLCFPAVFKPPRARGIPCACPCRACVMQNGRSRVTLATTPGGFR